MFNSSIVLYPTFQDPSKYLAYPFFCSQPLFTLPTYEPRPFMYFPIENSQKASFYMPINSQQVPKMQETDKKSYLGIKTESDLMNNNLMKDFFEEITPIQNKKNKPTKENKPKIRFRPTKNVESNIVNQSLSFASNKCKSQKVLLKFLFKDQQKAYIFYQYMKILLKFKKKYMSKASLVELCRISSNIEINNHLTITKNTELLSIAQFQSVLLLLIEHYLKFECVETLLTSKKIIVELKGQHLAKRRVILEYFKQNKNHALL